LVGISSARRLPLTSSGASQVVAHGFEKYMLIKAVFFDYSGVFTRDKTGSVTTNRFLNERTDNTQSNLVAPAALEMKAVCFDQEKDDASRPARLLCTAFRVSSIDAASRYRQTQAPVHTFVGSTP
jgi:hypothetical protein